MVAAARPLGTSVNLISLLGDRNPGVGNFYGGHGLAALGKKGLGFSIRISEIFRNGDEYIYIMNIIVSMKIV